MSAVRLVLAALALCLLLGCADRPDPKTAPEPAPKKQPDPPKPKCPCEEAPR